MEVGFTGVSPLETSFWRPAFIVAAAWRDMEARLGELGGDSPVRYDWSAIGKRLFSSCKVLLVGRTAEAFSEERGQGCICVAVGLQKKETE